MQNDRIVLSHDVREFLSQKSDEWGISINLALERMIRQHMPRMVPVQSVYVMDELPLEQKEQLRQEMEFRREMGSCTNGCTISL